MGEEALWLLIVRDVASRALQLGSRLEQWFRPDANPRPVLHFQPGGVVVSLQDPVESGGLFRRLDNP